MKFLSGKLSVCAPVKKQMLACIGRKGGMAWAKTLKTNSGITNLDIQKNRMGDRACSSIISAMKSNSHVTKLNLSDNQLGIKTSVELRDMFYANTTLTDLDISWNHIRPQDLCALSPGLRVNTTVKILSLAWNGIGDKFMEPSDTSSPAALDQTQKSTKSKPSTSPPKSPKRPATAGTDAGAAILLFPMHLKMKVFSLLKICFVQGMHWWD